MRGLEFARWVSRSDINTMICCSFWKCLWRASSDLAFILDLLNVWWVWAWATQFDACCWTNYACLKQQEAKSDEREIQPFERSWMLFEGDLERRWEKILVGALWASLSIWVRKGLLSNVYLGFFPLKGFLDVCVFLFSLEIFRMPRIRFCRNCS